MTCAHASWFTDPCSDNVRVPQAISVLCRKLLPASDHCLREHLFRPLPPLRIQPNGTVNAPLRAVSQLARRAFRAKPLVEKRRRTRRWS